MKKLCFILMAGILLICSACSDNSQQPDNSSTSQSISSNAPSTPEDTQAPTESPEPENPHPGELLFKGTPMTWFLGSTIEEIDEFFVGDPDNNPDEKLHGGLKTYVDSRQVEASTNPKKLPLVSISTEQLADVTIDGVSLNNLSEAEKIIGNPAATAWDSGYLVETYYVNDRLVSVYSNHEEGMRTEPQSVYVRYFFYENADESKQALQEWLLAQPLLSGVRLEERTITEQDRSRLGPGTHDAFELIESDGASTAFYVCRETGKLYAVSSYGVTIDAASWYIGKYEFAGVGDNTNEGGVSGGNPGNGNASEPVSADGYVLGSGTTVYIRNGGYSLFGSATEGVINFKADGSASISWVAVLENMGLNGWERSEMYQDGFYRKFWSPTLKDSRNFVAPDTFSFSQLYVDISNIN